MVSLSKTLNPLLSTGLTQEKLRHDLLKIVDCKTSTTKNIVTF